MRRCQLFILASISYVPYSFTQQFSQAIEDNSYFIEEAYNQEFRVVQHISTGYYQNKTKDFVYLFTQEWPLSGQTHQLSYTIPYESLKVGSHGFGDILINYRYQLWDEQHWGWIAPRLSIILPTGNSATGLGNGVVGVQVCAPLSKRWTNEFISHFNLGCTLLPNVEGTTGISSTVHHTLASYFAGVSGIWLLTENFNLLCEALFSINSAIVASGNVAYSPQTIISPGFRFAINLGSLQIVPGLALPIIIASGDTEVNIFGYLSFEHPF